MMNRRNQILAAVLVLQLVVVAVVFWPRGKTSAAGLPLFPGVQSDQVTRLSVSVADGEESELVKSGAGWVLANADDYPVLTATLTSVLEKMVSLVGSQPVATTSSSYKRLQVADDDYKYRVEFELAGGDRQRLYVGNSPSYGAAYVRVDGQKEVYLASFQTSDLGTGPGSWVERAYLKIDAQQVTQFTLQNGQGTFQFVKSGESWTMTGLEAGEVVDSSKVQALLTRVNPLTMLRPLGKSEKAEYGLAQPLAVLEVTTPDKSYRLEVGALEADGQSYVVSSYESPYFVRVSQYSVADLVEKGRDGFLVQPTPAPTPEPTAAP